MAPSTGNTPPHPPQASFPHTAGLMRVPGVMVGHHSQALPTNSLLASGGYYNREYQLESKAAQHPHVRLRESRGQFEEQSATSTSQSAPHHPAVSSKKVLKPTDDPDLAMIQVPWLTESQVKKRREIHGLDDPEVLAFTDKCEFIGLGCFCGVTRSLQCLGLKKNSYPFDWTRSDLPGVMHCLNCNFEDFFNFSTSAPHPNKPDKTYYGGTDWGGSFWHHDPRDKDTKQKFKHRADRLFGRAEVPATTWRVFCITLNRSDDLKRAHDLYKCLQRVIPDTRIYLLIFMDNQATMGPVRVAGYFSDRILFFWTGEDLFKENGRYWEEQRHAEAYAEGVATAVRAWAGVEGEAELIPTIASLKALYAVCDHYDGRPASSELYWPKRVPPSMPSARSLSCDSDDEEAEDVLCSPADVLAPVVAKDVSICGCGLNPLWRQSSSRKSDGLLAWFL